MIREDELYNCKHSVRQTNVRKGKKKEKKWKLGDREKTKELKGEWKTEKERKIQRKKCEIKRGKEYKRVREKKGKRER